MDKIEREALRGHLTTLARWLRNGKLEAPSAPQLAAIEAAVDTMKGLANSWENYEQPIAILRYHISHPTALLFRDPVTIKVMKIAIDAMERKLDGGGRRS
jgi:hypothetical protein